MILRKKFSKYIDSSEKVHFQGFVDREFLFGGDDADEKDICFRVRADGKLSWPRRREKYGWISRSRLPVSHEPLVATFL